MSPSIEATETAPHQPSAARFLPLLLLLFIGSGCAALMYEIVWYQMLQLAIGSTSISIGFLLATFMGGLCIGSIWLPRLKTNLHPLKLYAYIEMGIGICGLFVLWLLPLLDNVYFAITGYGFWDMVLRAALSAIFLLPPTILMGASLPAASRWIQSTAAGASWWGAKPAPPGSLKLIFSLNSATGSPSSSSSAAPRRPPRSNSPRPWW